MRKFTLSTPQPRAALIASYAYGQSSRYWDFTLGDPYWALISQADRDKAASSGAAMDDGSYPIFSCEGDNSVDTAIGAVGRGSADHDAIRRHIIKRADSLGCSSKIPDNWNTDGSLKDAATSTQTTALAAPPAPAPTNGDAPAPDKPADGDAADPDAAVTEAIAKLKSAVDAAQAAQKADPDTDDPNDKKVSDGLASIAQAVDQLTSDQAADVAGEDGEDKNLPPAPPKPPVTAAAAATTPPAAGAAPNGEGAATAPKTNPVDEHGNVDSGAKCANPDCGHLASSHVDTPDGENTGGCSMANCECQGMQVEAEPNTGNGDDQAPDQGNQGAQPSPESQELANAPSNAVPDAPAPPGAPAAPAPAPQLNAPPPVAGSENMGPAFTIPVLVIEGQPTTDGRQLVQGALSWPTPPLPLMGLATETHDPEGFDMNAPAVMCGRIDSLERQAGDGDTQVIVAKGFYLPNEDGIYFAGLTESMGRCGISADIAVQAVDVQVTDSDADGFPIEMEEKLTEGRLMGATQVPFPAFEGAYVVLGDGTDKPAAQAIPQQADEPATPAKPPAAVTAGGQLVHLMSYAECERCEQGLELVASGGPAAPPTAWFSDPNFTEGDGRLVEILDRRGQRALAGKFACPLTVTDDGRVYGHLAPWDVCHIGKPGCVTAPSSDSDYAYFKRGQHVITAEGEQIRVGTITVDAGHADVKAGSAAAMAHYDNIATAVADVNCGEDDYGIWVAGAIRPTATPAQVAALRASSISGDWRGLGGSLELVAALAVPVPGFPHAVVADGHEMLVAAGTSVMHALKHPAEPEPSEEGDVALRRALSPLLKTSRESARERLSALSR